MNELDANYSNIKKLSRKEARRWLNSEHISVEVQAMLFDKVFGKEPIRRNEEETPSAIKELFKS